LVAATAAGVVKVSSLVRFVVAPFGEESEAPLVETLSLEDVLASFVVTHLDLPSGNAVEETGVEIGSLGLVQWVTLGLGVAFEVNHDSHYRSTLSANHLKTNLGFTSLIFKMPSQKNNVQNPPEGQAGIDLCCELGDDEVISQVPGDG